MASKFRFRTIWVQKGHENDSMQEINFNVPNFLWKFLGVFGIHRLITIIILFTNFTKPYSSESKFRCRQFDTFWRFLAFVLAKLPLKAELENGVRFKFLSFRKLARAEVQSNSLWPNQQHCFANNCRPSLEQKAKVECCWQRPYMVLLDTHENHLWPDSLIDQTKVCQT